VSSISIADLRLSWSSVHSIDRKATMIYICIIVLISYSDMTLGLNAKCPVFLSSFNNVCIFLVDFNESLQFQTSRKFVQWQTS
jgi:hypothetical protein